MRGDSKNPEVLVGDLLEVIYEIWAHITKEEELKKSETKARFKEAKVLLRKIEKYFFI